VSKQRIGYIRVGLMEHGERFMPVLPGILAELNGCSIRDLDSGKAR
jgi:hypothetical protein